MATSWRTTPAWGVNLHKTLSAEQLCQSLCAAFQQQDCHWACLVSLLVTFMPATFSCSDGLRKLP